MKHCRLRMRAPSPVSYAVNPEIVKFLEDLNSIDKPEYSLPMVYAEAKECGRDAPFEEIIEAFKVTLF